MPHTVSQAFVANFLGHSPGWYKLTIITFLIVNPIVVMMATPFVAGWLLIGEFIFTLAMALKCYPLQPGGLLAIQAIALGLATPDQVYEETIRNFPVILLLMFMVAGVFFLKDLLLFVFTKILLGVRSKTLLSVLFSATAAVLSAFLDALTVTAVVITVAGGFYAVYHRVASGKHFETSHDHARDDEVHDYHREDLEQFRSFLRSLVMHAAVGTALGGVMTLVGEPQNLLIAEVMDWNFITFFLMMAPISIPVFFAGLVTCALLEQTKFLDYGTKLPTVVRDILTDFNRDQTEKRTSRESAILVAQAVAAMLLVLGLGFHVAEVGLVGLAIIILATTLTGVTEEHRLGKAFEEALPFTALLVVFFSIVAVIEAQHLFHPVTSRVLALEGDMQTAVMYLANGVLSMISDNVFVATVYIGEVNDAFDAGVLSRAQFENLAIAINTGTNIPSVATPNGQAAFLFLLTSALAPLIRLSYGRMVMLALPYTIVMTIVGLLSIIYLM